MTVRTVIARSLRFFWRTHLGVLAGTALTCAILTGALVVGDSERFTLRQIANARLGKTESVLQTQEHFFRANLADELAGDQKTAFAPVLMMRGSASVPDGRARANDVQVLGVDQRFWNMGDATNLLEGAAADEVVLNERLARQLSLRAGDELILRVEQPSVVSRDAPLSGRSDTSVAIRGRVRAVGGDAEFGRFSLQANQVPPLSVFLPLTTLQQLLNHAAKANLLLTSAGTNANQALARHWTFADAGLELRPVTNRDEVELRTERVFLAPELEKPALALASVSHAPAPRPIPPPSAVLTYFVNEIRLGERSTPYSFVAAVGHEQPDDQITINSWLAEDLAAKVGDELTLRYWVIGERRDLIERTAKFRVGKIIPLENDPSWMPDFPGLSDKGNCRDWEPGTPIDTSKIRTKDEDYWKKYRGTPKAFITLAAGQKLWSNRFGDLTAVRYSKQPGLEKALRDALDPAALGLFFVPVHGPAITATSQAMDFGQLFIGFSFFLIVAALMLTIMLYVLSLEQRAEEAGLLRALGFGVGQLRRLQLLEGCVLALFGTALGLGAGVLYTKLTLHGLSTVWQKATAGSAFRYHAEAGTLLLGVGLSFVAALVAMWFAQRRLAKHAPAELLGGGGEVDWLAQRASNKVANPSKSFKPRRGGLWLGLLMLLGAIITVATSDGKNPEIFFTAGSLVLIAGIAFSRQLLLRLLRANTLAKNLAAVGRRNASRRRGRSLTTMGVLASGVFLIVAVTAFHQQSNQGPGDRSSGTGGFALFGRAALPVYDDLNSTQGRELFGLDAAVMKDVSVLPLRVREGDDASCLNLNRAVQPRLLGVQASELQRRHAFQFLSKQGSWELLEQPAADGAVPAIGDEQTVKWALGKKLGDTLAYTDDRGKIFTIRITGVIASSVLQGSLVISERNFVERFLGTSGYRAFLIDAPSPRITEVSQALTRGLQDRGLELTPAWQRLADFMEVENTYIAIFQALGGFGLVLGSVGFGIIVFRNVLERRGELALLQAVGFQRTALRRLVLSEHWPLIFGGLGIGLVAAIVALWPTLISRGSHLPFAGLGALLAGLAIGGMLWSWLAAWLALRGKLITALRNE